jgi:hypothetical protein
MVQHSGQQEVIEVDPAVVCQFEKEKLYPPFLPDFLSSHQEFPES